MQLDLFNPQATAPLALPSIDPEIVDPNVKLAIKPRDYQVRGIEKAFELFDAGEPGVIYRQPTGCHAKGAMLRRYAGPSVAVEDVVGGDLLLGPDGEPRIVLSLCRGRQEMALITPADPTWDAFEVNVDHVLTLGMFNGFGRPLLFIDVRVSDYIQWPDHHKREWELFKVSGRATSRELFLSGYEITNRSGFAVFRMPEADYYGFTLYGDGRYVMADGTVTHNTGKTVSGTLIANRWIHRSPDHYCLVLAHERQLVSQFAQEIEDILGWRPGIEMADQKVFAGSMPRIVVASRQTLFERKLSTPNGDEVASRLYKFDNQKHWLVLIDECHRWAWKLKSCQHIVEWFAGNPQSRRVGVTATPVRSSDNVSLARLFPAVASDYRYVDAVKDGWLVPYDQRFVQVQGVDFKNLREVAGDFDEDQLETLLTERETLLSLVTPTLDLVQHRRTIIFNPTVGMAKMVAATLNEFSRYKCGHCGHDQWQHKDEANELKAECKQCGSAIGPSCEIATGTLAKSLDGSYPDDERQIVYHAHQTGAFQFLSVCGLCREGYNDPGIQAVAVFRPTKSKALAEQMKGRGCRPLKGIVSSEMTVEERKDAIAASSKPNCTIVDLVGVSGMGDVASTASIFAEGKPDEVVDRANELILAAGEDGEPVDVLEQLELAEQQLAEEKEEEERKKREAEERRKKEHEERLKREAEEAERRRKIRGEVQYTATQVRSGQGGTSGDPKKEKVARMPFGRHKGEPISSLHENYLRGIMRIDDLAPWLKRSIEKEITKREGRSHAPQAAPSAESPATVGQLNLLRRFGLPEASTYAEAAAGIAEINRRLKNRANST
jgi:superfamily II DNA or RNA helicase